MKKFFFFAASVLATLQAGAQDYNFFPSSDGWLWFNTQQNIDTYVGLIDETNYKVEGGADAKIVQMVYADQAPDYPATVADINIVGAGTDGETGSAGSTTGALVLQPASASMTPNGGGFVLALPSCSKLTIDYSSNSRVMFRLLATTNASADMSKAAATNDLSSAAGWKIISAAYMSVFKRLPSGHNQFSLEGLNNGSDATTIKSEEPIYVWFQSGTNDTIYIHGVYVATPKKETTGISDALTGTSDVPAEVFTIDGRSLGNTSQADLKRGVYVIRRGNKSNKVVVK